MTDDTSCDGTDYDAHDEAQVAFGQLADRLATAENDQGDIHEKLEGLQSIDGVPEPGTEYSECYVSITFHGKSVTVQLDKHSPELIPCVTSKAPKNGEQGHTGTKTHLRESISGGKGTQDVSRDQIKDCAPKSLVSETLTKDIEV